MIIILEGVDGTGKSRLAKKLCRTYKAKLIHVSKPKTDNPFLEYVKMLQRLKVEKNYVFDRCFHGERAYGPHFRKKDGLSDEKQFYLETLIEKHSPSIIYCWQGSNEIAMVYAFRGEKYTKLEDVPNLRKLYDQTLEKCKFPVLRWRWSSDSYETVKMFIRGNSVKPWSNAHKKDMPEFIGARFPDVLFIGDQKNQKLQHLPVFCSNSGMFLMGVLKKTGKLFAIVNSKDLAYPQILKFNAKKIVLLGKNALAKCFYLDNKVVPHPQWAKRFGGKNASEKYLEEMKEALNEI